MCMCLLQRTCWCEKLPKILWHGRTLELESCMSRLLSHGMLSVQSWTCTFIHTYFIDCMMQSIWSFPFPTVLYLYFHEFYINISTVHNVGYPRSIGAVSVINHYYGRDDIVLGAFKGDFGKNHSGNSSYLVFLCRNFINFNTFYAWLRNNFIVIMRKLFSPEK